MKRSCGAVLTSLFLLNPFFCFAVYANSSWKWISDQRPIDLLPYVIIGTLLIETIAISYIPKIKSISRVFIAVTLANLLSYCAPFVFLAVIKSMYTFTEQLEHLPIYIVGIAYLLLTLILELPAVYLSLKSIAENKRTLLLAIFGTNVFTTILVAITERLMCYGQW